MIDWDKAEKLPAEYRYFNISVIWIFYYRLVLKILYKARVPHEAVTLFSIVCGLVSAYFFFSGKLIPAAVALHLKDLFDACDGALARLTGRGYLAGRYLDSLGDFVSLTAVVAAIAVRNSGRGQFYMIYWAALTILSLFLQCSVFNYFNLKYSEHYGSERLLSSTSESTRKDINLEDFGWATRLLRLLYLLVYSWQDRLVARFDNDLFRKRRPGPDKSRYGSKIFMTALSPLCFGTHIFIIIIFTLWGKPELSFPFIAVIMNFYMILLFYSAGGR